MSNDKEEIQKPNGGTEHTFGETNAPQIDINDDTVLPEGAEEEECRLQKYH